MNQQPAPEDPILRRLARLDPASGDELSGEEREAARERAIRLGEQESLEDVRRHGTGHGRSRWMPIRLAGVVGVGWLIALLIVLGGGEPTGTGTGPEFAAAAVRVAEANPRLIVAQEGWSVDYADQFEPDSGETHHTDGTSELQITWHPARFYQDYRQDRARDPGPDVPIEVLGLQATMIQYGESTNFATMLPPQGDVFIEIRGDLGSEDAYREILDSLEQTDVETWLAAMPPSVVQPSEQEVIVDALLGDVPLPPGFDLERLRGEARLNREGLVLEIGTSVACGWLDSWAEATKRGDEAAAAAAVAAMASSGEWPALTEPGFQKAKADLIGEYARQIADGRRIDREFGSVGSVENGVEYEYGPDYANALGCDSIIKRRVGD